MSALLMTARKPYAASFTPLRGHLLKLTEDLNAVADLPQLPGVPPRLLSRRMVV